MFRDEMSCARMQRSSQEGRENEVRHCFPTQSLYDGVVKSELSCNVEGVNPGDRKFVDHHRPDCVEEDLERAEEGLPSY